MPHTLYASLSATHLSRGMLRTLPRAEAGRLIVSRFKDGELSVRLRDLPKGPVTLVASTGPGESRMIETVLALDALKAAHAVRPLLVVPYAGFARQDTAFSGVGTPARLFAKLFRSAGAHTVAFLDPHSSVLIKAAPRLVALTAVPALAAALKGIVKDAVVVAPDHGARGRAMQLAAHLGGLPTAYVTKSRPAPDTAVARQMTGASVQGKTVILIDDIIDTGGTLLAAARLAKKNGAARVVAAATHGIFSGSALRDLSACCAELLVTDSLPHADMKKVRVIGCAPVLAAAVRKYGAG